MNLDCVAHMSIGLRPFRHASKSCCITSNNQGRSHGTGQIKHRTHMPHTGSQIR